MPRIRKLSKRPVAWIDPAPAIARRVTQLIGPPVPGHEACDDEALAVFTSGAGITPAFREALRGKGLPAVLIEDMPLLQG